MREKTSQRRLPLVMRAAQTMLTAAVEERSVLDAAAMLLGDHFGYGTRSVLLWDDKRRDLYVASSGGVGADTPDVRKFRTPLGKGLTGAAAELRRVINVGDVRRDPRYIQTFAQCVSEICTPILVHDQLLGVVTVQSDRINAFDADDEAVLTAFAQLLALALLHARANEARGRDMAELRAIADVAREATSLQLQKTLDTVVERFRGITTSDSVAIYLPDAGTTELVPAAVSWDSALYPADYVQRIGRVPRNRGMVGWAAEHLEPAMIDDTGKDPRPHALPGIPLESKSAIVVPLLVEGKLRGVIRATKLGVAQYTNDHFRLAQTLASQAAIAIAAVQSHEEVKRLAITDDLTGCFNARYLTSRLADEVERAKRHRRPLALFIADSDSLKVINDRYGHACGDLLLVDLAATIRGSVRAIDVVARYGGDEFVVIAPETTLEAASATAERVRAAVRAHPFMEPESGGHAIATVSIGVAAFTEGDDAGMLFGRADRALYQAKQQGKDRVVHLSQNLSKS